MLCLLLDESCIIWSLTCSIIIIPRFPPVCYSIVICVNRSRQINYEESTHYRLARVGQGFGLGSGRFQVQFLVRAEKNTLHIKERERNREQSFLFQESNFLQQNILGMVTLGFGQSWNLFF